MKQLQFRLRAGGAMAVVVMCLTAVMPLLSLLWLNETRSNRGLVDEQTQSLRRVMSLLVYAEAGQRGYVITGKEEFLQPYRTASAELPAELLLLKKLYQRASGGDRQIVDGIILNARRKLDELARTVEVRRAQGFDAAERIVSGGAGKQYMDEVRRLTEELDKRDAAELDELDKELASKVTRVMAFSIGSTVLTLLLLAYLSYLVAVMMRKRMQAVDEAQEASRQLALGMEALEARNKVVASLGEMSRVLQAEMGLVEVLEVTGHYCGQLLPGTSGSIYLFRNSADLLELAARWGGDVERQSNTMLPSACWGLRSGQMHTYCGPSDLRCQHYADGSGAGCHVCVPLMAYGEVLGQLHIWTNSPSSAAQVDEIASLAQTIAEQVALALSNAKLRQVLRDQSIKDPLTGLFNRRYMEETLQREVARAKRNKTSLALIVADLDHFKQVNDTYGHPAGDAVLKGAALHLLMSLRASDTACRFGGEEFVLILPDCSKEAASAKAMELCVELKQLAFKDRAEQVQLTASFGVAAFPQDANTPENLLEKADSALYQAKTSGRDRVVGAVS